MLRENIGSRHMSTFIATCYVDCLTPSGRYQHRKSSCLYYSCVSLIVVTIVWACSANEASNESILVGFRREYRTTLCVDLWMPFLSRVPNDTMSTFGFGRDVLLWGRPIASGRLQSALSFISYNRTTPPKPCVYDIDVLDAG
jgi:hypothetical protein